MSDVNDELVKIRAKVKYALNKVTGIWDGTFSETQFNNNVLPARQALKHTLDRIDALLKTTKAADE